MDELKKIRNFVIIAHIDHGKSTLADRMLEITETVSKRDMKEQLLDQMDLEREKGITIKLQPVKMEYQGVALNLIDTPGHVDFQYEVSRSLQAVEGAVLLVDATQGVQAQTLANLYMAIEQGLEIIPVVNKIDMPTADVDGTKKELSELLGVDEADILSISAKTGEGVEDVLARVIEKVPSPGPAKSAGETLRCLIFDSIYDDYRGVVAYIRVVEGEVKSGDKIKFIGTGVNDRVVEAGVFTPALKATGNLQAGDIGYLATGLKEVEQARVGDTITLLDTARQNGPPNRRAGGRSGLKALPGFKVPQPKVFAGIYPESGDKFSELREAIAKLKLNDASLTVVQEQSEALGQGFRCGFLGLLHLEIVQERLAREYDIELVITTPSVLYKVEMNNGEQRQVHTPAEFPDPSRIQAVQEQLAKTEVIVPEIYLGPVFELMQKHEGKLIKQEHLGPKRVLLEYVLPLRELVVDLYDQIKSATAGFGSLSYEMAGWQEADVVKLNILLNGEIVEALSVVVPRDKAEQIGRQVVKKLKEVIPKQLFAVPVQAAIGGTIVARETLSAKRKDVTAGLYGGDITRKRKVLERQKRGKKKLATGGTVKIPPEAYRQILKR